MYNDPPSWRAYRQVGLDAYEHHVRVSEGTDSAPGARAKISNITPEYCGQLHHSRSTGELWPRHSSI